MKEFFNWKHLVLILFGNTIYALTVVMFILPNELITGGTTGLGLIFYHQAGIPVSQVVTVFNAVMFLLGALVLGRKFALSTLVSSFYYPFILGQLERFPVFEMKLSQPLLGVIYAGILIGVGIGIVIRVGASTGGMDIPPLILYKKAGIPVSMSLYALDLLVLLGQMLFADREQVLYGILLVLIYTYVLDKVLLFGKSQMQVKIVTAEYEKVNQLIATELDRGSTLLQAETGHLRNDCLVILTVVSNRELPKLNQLVLKVDPKAFMVINQVTEVKGRGFSLKKKVL